MSGLSFLLTIARERRGERSNPRIRSVVSKVILHTTFLSFPFPFFLSSFYPFPLLQLTPFSLFRSFFLSFSLIADKDMSDSLVTATTKAEDSNNKENGESKHDASPSPLAEKMEEGSGDVKPEAKDEEDDESDVAEDEYIVEAILDVRRRGRNRKEYLIKWKGYDDPDDNTWEDESNV